MRSKMSIKMGISIVAHLLGCAFVVLGTKVSTHYLLIAFSLLWIGVSLMTSICCPYCGQCMTTKWSFSVPKSCPRCGKAISDEETEEA